MIQFDCSSLEVPYVKNLGQRGVADQIEALISEIASKAKLPEGYRYEKARSKRSVEDFSFRSSSKSLWYDVKSHDVNGEFCMPNLVSIDRCRKVLKDDSQDIIYIFVAYEVDEVNEKVNIKEIEFRPIHTLDHSCLAIQNLGMGVLQIKNAHKVLYFYSEGRYNWMVELSSMAVAFYEKQVTKFERMKTSWV